MGNLSRNEQDLQSPAWHEQALDEREQRVKSGQEQFVSWEDAKRELATASHDDCHSAVSERGSGCWFCVLQQEAGLGSYFLESLFFDIDSLRLYAGIHRNVFGFHRLLSKRFPYAIYYAVEMKGSRVRAVLDCRCDPGAAARAIEIAAYSVVVQSP